MKVLVSFVMIFWVSIHAYAGEMRIWGLSEPPGNFIDENGEFVGLSVDIAREIQKRVGKKDKIEMIPWKRIYKIVLREPAALPAELLNTLKQGCAEPVFSFFPT